jgi:two-component system, NarL family, sensor histidine kinase DevS
VSRPPLTPTARLSGAVGLCLVSLVLCTALARTVPWLGLTVGRSDTGATLQVAHADGPAAAAGLQRGDSIVRIASHDGRISLPLTALDWLEEPDFLDTWAEEDAFYARQDSLTAILRGPTVALTVQRAGTELTAPLTPVARPLRALPLIFWLQLLFGASGMIIGAWVWALRPADWGPRVYAITGACFLIFANAAAVYSTRELAMPSELFHALSRINHFGATLFGAALCALFLVYPVRVARTGTIIAVFVAAFVWWLAGACRWLPDQNSGTRFPVMLAMLSAIGIAIYQWTRTRGDPAGRAILRWFAVSVLTGCGAFIGLTAVVSAIGGLPPIPQGYAFGFFVLMYAGLAVGLRQYRVFDLDQWAYRILFWGVIVAVFVGLDLALLGTAASSGGRLLLIATFLALGTFPVRRWVWSRLFARETMAPQQLFDRALHASYASTAPERDMRWRALLQELFDPLTSAEAADTASRGGAPDDVVLADQGQQLIIPAVASSPRLTLQYANGGTRLFRPADAQLARTLVSLMRSAEESRAAYDVGVARERSRIARDLHDTVSSPLLAGLAPLRTDDVQLAKVQSDIRRAVSGMRSVVSGDTGQPALLADTLADARFAAMERLGNAGLAVTWPIASVGETMLDADERHALTAFLQESITNVIKHAGATHVRVTIEVADGVLLCRVTDDGSGLDPALMRTGDGLPNLHARAAALSGTARIGPRPDGVRGTEVLLVATLQATASRR